MRHFRFSISALMAVVLLVALDCMAFNTLLHPTVLCQRQSIGVVFVGALPMANILAIGLIRLLTKRNRPGRTRPFLVGFEVFGGVALVVLLASTWLALTRFIMASMMSFVPYPCGQGIPCSWSGP